MPEARAAVEEGILPGGGGALVRAVESLKLKGCPVCHHPRVQIAMGNNI